MINPKRDCRGRYLLKKGIPKTKLKEAEKDVLKRVWSAKQKELTVENREEPDARKASVSDTPSGTSLCECGHKLKEHKNCRCVWGYCYCRNFKAKDVKCNCKQTGKCIDTPFKKGVAKNETLDDFKWNIISYDLDANLKTHNRSIDNIKDFLAKTLDEFTDCFEDFDDDDVGLFLVNLDDWNNFKKKLLGDKT
jgi:hypothetical protein